MHTTHYRRPGWFTRRISNQLVLWLTRAGVSVWGSRILEVRGRVTGLPRRVPVNVLTIDGGTYLVSARGEGEWVRNVRAAGGALTLRVGRRTMGYVASELADPDKAPVLRAYLRRWKAEVGVFFDGVGPDASDSEIERVAPKHPVFALAVAP